ncbi:MAG TPA: hypothetical protein PKY81_14100 [bacterium]|nr:hypothetical protein [bacterium]HPN32079.1 hypothetical protein [bacterium]
MTKPLNRILKIFWLIIILSFNQNFFQVFAEDTLIIKKSDNLNLNYIDDASYIIRLDGNIELEYSGVSVFSDSIIFDPSISRINSNSKTFFKSNDLEAVSDKFDFYLNREFNELSNVKLRFDKWHISAGKIKIKKNQNSLKSNSYTLSDVKITSCENDTPHYYFYSKKAKFKAKESISLYSPIFKVGKIPLLYFPYLKKKLGGDLFKYEIGYSKKEGGFALTEYSADEIPPFTYGFIADYFYYRGVGIGYKTEYDTSNYYVYSKGYYIGEKPVYYDIDSGKYSEKGGSRRDRWKTELKINSKIWKNINIRGAGEILSDNLIEKDYKERWSDLIINEFDNEFELASIGDMTVWHLIYERKDFWNYSLNRSDYSHIVFPDFRIMWNRINLNKSGLYFKPDISIKSVLYDNSIRNTDFCAAGYLIKKINSGNLLNFTVSAGLKFNGNRFDDGKKTDSKNKLNYLTEISRTDFYKNYYSRILHSFEKTFCNPDRPEHSRSSVLTNKFDWDNALIFNKSYASLQTGFNLDNDSVYSTFKERFEDVKFTYAIEFDSANSFSVYAGYNIKKSSLSICSLNHFFNSKSGIISFSNGLNFINKQLDDNIFQWNSEIVYNIFKNKIPEWILTFSQTADLNARYMKSQKISVVKDLHCFTSELSYKKNSKNDYSVYLVFNIKAYPKQGLGIQYNYGNKSVRFRQ